MPNNLAFHMLKRCLRQQRILSFSSLKHNPYAQDANLIEVVVVAGEKADPITTVVESPVTTPVPPPVVVATTPEKKPGCWDKLKACWARVKVQNRQGLVFAEAVTLGAQADNFIQKHAFELVIFLV